jgi:hypothetical protein
MSDPETFDCHAFGPSEKGINPFLAWEDVDGTLWLICRCGVGLGPQFSGPDTDHPFACPEPIGREGEEWKGADDGQNPF